MKIVTTVKEMQQLMKQYRKEHRSVGFVPTMGYLHEGHLSLLKEAKNQHDLVVLSIFVNPLQFGPSEDLDRYPRDFKRDEQLARDIGVDLLFYPSVTEMYPTEPPMSIHVTSGVDVLCGASRPGHFDGVTTVVMKLLMLTLPDRAYFGQKDAQQVAIITNMVDMFNIPVEVVSLPTIREEDGLAKSSRNVYLSPSEREVAPKIYQSLHAASELVKNGQVSVEIIKKRLEESLLAIKEATIDYVEVLQYPTLKRVSELEGTILIAVACQFKHARLIDNCIVSRSV